MSNKVSEKIQDRFHYYYISSSSFKLLKKNKTQQKEGGGAEKFHLRVTNPVFPFSFFNYLERVSISIVVIMALALPRMF
jgi:hypothetical protein